MREDWLLARRSVVTATDVARLAQGGPKVWAQVRAEKDGSGPERHVTRAMQWGIDREPALLRWAQTIDPTIRPNAELWTDGDFGATPDGVGDGVVCECKTTSTPFEEPPRRYADQMQWQMRVTGTSHCLFVWEQCAEDTDGFLSPVTRDYQWIDRDDSRIEFLEDIARQFLSGDTSVSWDGLLAEYALADAAVTHDEKRREEIRDEIRECIDGDQFKYVSDMGSISLTPATSRTTVDVKALKADFPEVYEKVAVTKTVKPRLRIEVGGE